MLDPCERRRPVQNTTGAGALHLWSSRHRATDVTEFSSTDGKDRTMRTRPVLPNHPFHLAEFNISRLKAPLDNPSMKEFVDFLDPVNTFAGGSPGFVWRLAAGDGAASTYLPPSYDDPMVITNLTVWTDLE